MFEKGGVNFRGFFLQRGWESKEIRLGAKIRGANSVSGEKLHDFKIICPARGGVRSHPLCVQITHTESKPYD